MKTLSSISLDTFKAQNHIQKLFIIKTSKVYNDESGNPTSTKRCYAASSESGEPILWLTKRAAERVESTKSANGLSVSSIETERGTFQVISCENREVLCTL